MTTDLNTLAGVTMIAGTGITDAFGSGKAETFDANEENFGGWEYSSVMDGGTCPFCSPLDGTVYPTLDALYAVLPNFGPNPSCHGRFRCRCTAIPLPPSPPPPPEVTGDWPTNLEGGRTSKQVWTGRGGDYGDARQALHRDIVDKTLAGAAPSPDANVLISGGGPASGKGSVVKVVSNDYFSAPRVHVDPDEFKQALPEYAQMVKAGEDRAAGYAHEESSDIAGMVRRRALGEHRPLFMDQVGGGPAKKLKGRLDEVRASGMNAKMVVVDIPTDEALKRNLIRSQTPGPDFGRLPDPKMVTRAHAEVAANWRDVAIRQKWLELELWDNAQPFGDLPTMIARKAAGSRKLEVFDRKRYRQFLAKAEKRVVAKVAPRGPWQRVLDAVDTSDFTPFVPATNVVGEAEKLRQKLGGLRTELDLFRTHGVKEAGDRVRLAVDRLDKVVRLPATAPKVRMNWEDGLSFPRLPEASEAGTAFRATIPGSPKKGYYRWGGEIRFNVKAGEGLGTARKRVTTTYHEFGHYLDGAVMGVEKVAGIERPVSEVSQLAVWRDFRGTAANTGVIRKWKTKVRPLALTAEEAYAAHFTSGNEVWARAFAQYVAWRSRASLLGIADYGFAGAYSGWLDDDWQKLVPKIEAVLNHYGILRGGQ